jgi:hypothetical protein
MLDFMRIASSVVSLLLMMMKVGIAFAVSSVANAVTQTDVVIYGLDGQNDAYASVLDVDTNTTRELEWAGWGELLDTRAGLIMQRTRHHGVRLLDLDGNELHRSNESWITAGDNVASPQFFGVEQFVTIGDRNATVWSSTSFKSVCSCKLNETITSANFDNSGRRIVTVSESGVAVWDSQDCGFLFHIADRGNYSASKLRDIVGFVGLDHIAMLHTDASIENYVHDYYSHHFFHWNGAELSFHDASTGQELYTVSAPDPDSLTLEPAFSYYSDFRLGSQDHFKLHVSPEGSNVAIAYHPSPIWPAIRGGRSVQVFNSKGALLTDFSHEEQQWSAWRLAGLDPTGTKVLVDQRQGDNRSIDGTIYGCPCFAASYDVASGLQTHSMHYSDSIWRRSEMHFLHNGTRVLANSGCPVLQQGQWGVGACLHVWDFASGTELALVERADHLHAFGTVAVTPVTPVLV